MDVKTYLRLREYMDHTDYRCKHSLTCYCDLDKIYEEMTEKLNLCRRCNTNAAEPDIKNRKYCLACLKIVFPLAVNQKIKIENSEGIVVEVEDQDHFIVDFGDKGKKWFAWWHNYYDVQVRNLSGNLV